MMGVFRFVAQKWTSPTLNVWVFSGFFWPVRALRRIGEARRSAWVQVWSFAGFFEWLGADRSGPMHGPSSFHSSADDSR